MSPSTYISRYGLAKGTCLGQLTPHRRGSGCCKYCAIEVEKTGDWDGGEDEDDELEKDDDLDDTADEDDSEEGDADEEEGQGHNASRSTPATVPMATPSSFSVSAVRGGIRLSVFTTGLAGVPLSPSPSSFRSSPSVRAAAENRPTYPTMALA